MTLSKGAWTETRLNNLKGGGKFPLQIEKSMLGVSKNELVRFVDGECMNFLGVPKVIQYFAFWMMI